MGKYKENPRYEVISTRVTDEEKKVFRELAARKNMSVTDLMRFLLVDCIFTETKLAE